MKGKQEKDPNLETSVSKKASSTSQISTKRTLLLYNVGNIHFVWPLQCQHYSRFMLMDARHSRCMYPICIAPMQLICTAL